MSKSCPQYLNKVYLRFIMGFFNYSFCMTYCKNRVWGKGEKQVFYFETNATYGHLLPI